MLTLFSGLSDAVFATEKGGGAAYHRGSVPGRAAARAGPHPTDLSQGLPQHAALSLANSAVDIMVCFTSELGM